MNPDHKKMLILASTIVLGVVGGLFAHSAIQTGVNKFKASKPVSVKSE